MNIIEYKPLFTNLMPDQAAAIQGGYSDALCVYGNRNGLQLPVQQCFKYGIPKLPPGLDNNISRIVIHAGKWRFFDGFNYTGAYFDKTPGTYNLYSNQWWNDKISSIKRIA